jgi:epoxyqueuosine reductase
MKKLIKNLCEQIKKELYRQGATHVVQADLSPLRNQGVPLIQQSYKNSIVEEYPYAISIGIGLSKGIVRLLHDMETHSISQTYNYHCYTVINPRLDVLALWTVTTLQNAGYNALPLPSSQYRFKDFSDTLRAVFPHKTAAYLGGMGWIGKNCLLVTENCGAALRLVTVLTDAPLKAGSPMQSLCGDCSKCVDNCPAEAIKGVEFDPAADRDERIDVWKCDDFRSKRETKMGNRSCGLCIYHCPFSLQNLEDVKPTRRINR